MPNPNKKQRLSVYLEPGVTRALAEYAARRAQSRSLVAEAAIASFLSPDAAERQEAALTKRLDQLDRRMARLERDLGIAVETLAVFVRFWLTTNPPLPEPAQAAARAKAGERYDAFVAALGRRLAKGPKLRQEISEDVPADASNVDGLIALTKQGDRIVDLRSVKEGVCAGQMIHACAVISLSRTARSPKPED